MTRDKALKELQDRLDNGEKPFGLFWDEGTSYGGIFNKLASIENKMFCVESITGRNRYKHFAELTNPSFVFSKEDFPCVLSNCED